MEFCPDCGAMLFPKDGVLKCNSCGYSNENIDEDNYNLKKEIKAGETVTNLGEDVEVGPVTNETCPECGNNVSPDTKFCNECGTKIE